MPVKAQGSIDGYRRSRSHPKSRSGCGNCKVRKIKCDEGKPVCKKCEAYGTSCNYDGRESAFQPVARGDGYFHTLSPPPRSDNRHVLDVINCSQNLGQANSSPFYCNGNQFSMQHLELLSIFRTRTILTVSIGKGNSVHRDTYIKLAYSHPFLLHIVLTLTLMHNQYLASGPTSKLSAAIAFHWSQGASLLNERLSGGVKASERDALWACAGLLGALSFASCTATTRGEAWPLKSYSSSDLDWLKMTEGKKAIWKIADPMRRDSVFYPTVPNFLQFAEPISWSPELLVLPVELIRLCKLDDLAMQDGNPYLATASSLARMVGDKCTTDNMGLFLSFLGCMNRDFRQLLERNDPCALLLMAYWYSMILPLQEWWMLRRSRLECQAIWKYLELYHGDDPNISSMLRRIQMTSNQLV